MNRKVCHQILHIDKLNCSNITWMSYMFPSNKFSTYAVHLIKLGFGRIHLEQVLESITVNKKSISMSKTLHETFYCHGDPEKLTYPNSPRSVFFFLESKARPLFLSLFITIICFVHTIIGSFYISTNECCWCRRIKDVSISRQLEIIMQPKTRFCFPCIIIISWF